MWRNYVICVLIGLLLVASGSSVVLLRQSMLTQATTEQLRQRVVSAQATQTSLQQQVDQLKPAGATPPAVAAPLPTIGPEGPALALLQRIESDVSTLRGLSPKTDVPKRFLDRVALQQLYLDRFNKDYLPSERESDQKLLTTLGMVGPNDSVVQILLDVIQEQILGIYNPDDKVMYMLADPGSGFGPAEKDTFAEEFDHALQDQYFDLGSLAPRHPDNDDRSLAIQALTEGDALLIQRLWAQQNLSQDELNQLTQGGGASRLYSAPLFLREQLLFPYSDGFTFIRQIYQVSGYAGVDAIFRDPPQSTAQILHIDKYRGHVAPVEVTLPDLSADESLGGGWRKISSNVFGELDLRLMLTQLTDSAHGVRGASGWAGDRWELLEKGGHQAVVLKTVWDNDGAAATFFDTFGQGMKNRFFGAREEEVSSARQALTATNFATELRRSGSTVVAVISFDRASAEALANAVPS